MFLKHKRAIAMLTVVIMMSVFLTCFCGHVLAETWEGPFKYKITGGEAQINAYYASNSDEGIDLVIPQSLGGFPVTSIAEETFLLRRGTIKSINIPMGVKELGSPSGLCALEEINIPDDVTQINDHCFLGCSRLPNIKIPNSVNRIGEGAFMGCTALWGILGGEGITSISNNAFYGCTSLCFFQIPKGVTTIGDETFANCTSMRSITIPKGITSIGKEAFYVSGLDTIIFESPSTVIYDSTDTIPEYTTIIGYPSSTAEDYAKKYNRTFQDISLIGDKKESSTPNPMIITIILLGLICLGLSIKLARVTKQNKELLNSNTARGFEIS